MLRSDTRTVVLKFGGEGIGHGHPDKLSIAIHDGKRELISDFGTSGYGVPDYLKWYKRSLSHNTVTVDAKDQKEVQEKLLNLYLALTVDMLRLKRLQPIRELRCAGVWI